MDPARFFPLVLCELLGKVAVQVALAAVLHEPLDRYLRRRLHRCLSVYEKGLAGTSGHKLTTPPPLHERNHSSPLLTPKPPDKASVIGFLPKTCYYGHMFTFNHKEGQHEPDSIHTTG